MLLLLSELRCCRCCCCCSCCCDCRCSVVAVVTVVDVVAVATDAAAAVAVVVTVVVVAAAGAAAADVAVIVVVDVVVVALVGVGSILVVYSSCEGIFFSFLSLPRALPVMQLLRSETLKLEPSHYFTGLLLPLFFLSCSCRILSSFLIKLLIMYLFTSLFIV